MIKIDGDRSQSSVFNTPSQYHYYIPKILLQNFSHTFKLSGGLPWWKSRSAKGEIFHPRQSLLNNVDLAAEDANIVEQSIGRTVGITNLSRDRLGYGKNAQYVEDKLSILEYQAAAITGKILDCFNIKEAMVTITRPERDTLRKFLFITRYCSFTAHGRLYFNKGYGYSANDRRQMSEYMEEKGFESPFDVWLDNIKAMLDAQMDPEGKWLKWLIQHAYPDDAIYFFTHCQAMYLALCTPVNPGDEFFLTENANSIHEGPDRYFRTTMTDQRLRNCYAEFHIFVPVSPKLMLVLRSSLLPSLGEYTSKRMKSERARFLELLKVQHGLNQPGSGSILQDLPIKKAENSYSHCVNGRQFLRKVESESHSVDNTFSFRFFPISSKHTNRINFIMLENAAMISTIVFNNHSVLRRTLREYLCTPSEVEGLPCFKVFEGPQDAPRLVFLKKLVRLLEILDRKAGETGNLHIGPDQEPLRLI